MSREFWKEVVKFTGDLWYNREERCVICGQGNGAVCADCRKNYIHPELRRCTGCGKLMESETTYCRDCSGGRGPKHLNKITAWGYYSGELKEFIHKIKFRAEPTLIKRIMSPLADWVIGQLPVVDGIVPIPMHAARLSERGYNQAEVIASGLHWELGLPIFAGVERLERRSPQASLSRQERLTNLKGAFTVKTPESFQGKTFWLVDDVTTTGSTLDTVAEVLRKSGAKEIYGVCLAAGMEKRLVPLED